jgi:hypothetical protein
MSAKFKSKTHLLNTIFEFWRRFLRVWLQSLKNALISNMTLKRKYFSRAKKVSKNAEFHADLKSVEKVLKNSPKKSYN